SANGDLVEHIVDRRRNKKGKWEYLIRWKGYGSKEDTWEPENHLLHCEEFIDRFNSMRLHPHKQHRIPKSTIQGGTVLPIGSRGSGHVHKLGNVGHGPGKHAPLQDKMGKAMTFRTPPIEAPRLVAQVREADNGHVNGCVQPHNLGAATKSHRVSSDRVDGGSPLANGKMQLHSSVKRKLTEEKCYVFDKRLRYNVRQNENNCRFRDIVVRKEDGFTHVLLSSQTTDNNALTPEIMKEVCRALGNAAADDSKLLLLSSVGTIFCSGIEPSYLIGRLSTDRRKESSRIADAVRDFVLAFIRFKKPIVVAINGPALGLGASILPLCDVVWASERAWFQTPCAALHLTPSGCSSYTFPQILGVALANEMLFCGRKLTAQEACNRGLVSQVFWPTTFNQEVMLRVKEMASCNAVVLEESKCLVRSILLHCLEEVNEKECQMLKQLWCSTKGLEALFSYLHNKTCEK
uniref:Chromodomain Y like 2 n=1 Tax=Hippocampus comes TaxID=109280 RepID=A0A3Q2Z1L3_HIPCM